MDCLSWSPWVLTLALACAAASWGDPDPAHVWHFDEAAGDLALDCTTDFIDLTLMGGARRVEGLFGAAVQTGEGGYLQGEGLGPMATGAVECWVKPLEEMGASQFGIVGFGKRYGERNDYALLGVFPGVTQDDPVQFGFGICKTTWDGARVDAGPSLNEWHHIVANWGRLGTQLYVDGALVAEEDVRFDLPDHAAIFLGASSWGRTYSMIVDEVRIYRDNLSAEAVSAHHADRSYVASPPALANRMAHFGPTEGALVTVADYASPDSLTCGIEEAIAALPREGGEVYIPPGRYLLRRSIWVPSNVTLRGAGGATVLLRPTEVQTRVTAAAETGESVIQVEDASGLEVGADVSVYADGVHGWHSTTAHIEAIDGNAVTLSRGLNKPVDPDKNAGMINYFPMITAEHRRDFTVRDLTIDGGAGKPNEGVMDFTWAALHFYDCRDLTIANCRLRNYICDGISVQAGRGATISGCLIENCRGHGMHPGTGLQDSVWINNISRENTWDGLFFCMRVMHSIISNNVLADNGHCGIGHIGGGGDKYNVVSNNTCVRNGRWGIHVYAGTDNVVTGNLCLNNSQAEPGRFPGIGVIQTTDSVITGNRCLDDQETKTQSGGVVEVDKSDQNLITGNQCRGNLGPGVSTSGPNTEASGNMQ